MKLVDDNCVALIRKTGEFWPGGDIRNGGNQWLRTAFHRSELVKVPRKNSVRQSLREVIRKKKLRHKLSQLDCHISTVNQWCHVWLNVLGFFCIPLHHLYAGFGRSDPELESWIIEQAPLTNIDDEPCRFHVWFSLNGWYLRYFIKLGYSQAFRGHQILINHAKQKRKGAKFTSPSSKSQKKLASLLTLTCCMMFDFAPQTYKPDPQVITTRKSISVDDMETLPILFDSDMPDFQVDSVQLVFALISLLTPSECQQSESNAIKTDRTHMLPCWQKGWLPKVTNDQPYMLSNGDAFWGLLDPWIPHLRLCIH